MDCDLMVAVTGSLKTPADDKCFTWDLELEALRPLSSAYNQRRWILTVVVPFALHQLIYLDVSLWSWSELFPPCSESSKISNSVNLVFYSIVALSPDIQNRILDNCRLFRHCFGNISFVDARIPPERDAYGEGTVDMFYNLWGPQRENFLDPNQTNVMFYMEPDARVVRSNWLEQIYLESKSPNFWIRGSAPQFPIWPTDAATTLHINGNALFRYLCYRKKFLFP